MDKRNRPISGTSLRKKGPTLNAEANGHREKNESVNLYQRKREGVDIQLKSNVDSLKNRIKYIESQENKILIKTIELESRCQSIKIVKETSMDIKQKLLAVKKDKENTLQVKWSKISQDRIMKNLPSLKSSNNLCHNKGLKEKESINIYNGAKRNECQEEDAMGMRKCSISKICLNKPFDQLRSKFIKERPIGSGKSITRQESCLSFKDKEFEQSLEKQLTILHQLEQKKLADLEAAHLKKRKLEESLKNLTFRNR